MPGLTRSIEASCTRELRCLLHAPTERREELWYALRMLALPLGLLPVPVGSDEEADLICARSRPEDARAAFLVTDETAMQWDADAVEWRGESYPALVRPDGEPDLLRSTFFWLSGGAERMQRERDHHGRYTFVGSLHEEMDVGERPVVDAYRAAFAARLHGAGVAAERRTWDGSVWAFCPTVDVDYHRKWRPGIFYRELVEYPLLNLRGVSGRERWQRLRRSTKQLVGGRDPYRNALDLLSQQLAQVGAGTFLMKGGATGARDVAYHLDRGWMRRWIRRAREQGHELGLHPSYFTHDHPERLRAERMNVAAASGEAACSTRQHYLRWSADTPRHLSAAGFTIDSTLGFPGHVGFRRGTSVPFALWDVAVGAELPIWEMPLLVMESALFNRMNSSVDAAVRRSERLLRYVEAAGGAAVFLWHNMLGDEIDAPGWRAHFERTIDVVQRAEAPILSMRGAMQAWR